MNPLIFSERLIKAGMTNQQQNYLKTIYGSLPNLVFIGVMLFCIIQFSLAFCFLLIAGEASLLVLAQTDFVRALLRTRNEQDNKEELAGREEKIISSLPDSYRADYAALSRLCGEIEQRATDLRRDNAGLTMIAGITEKLADFRYQYAQMLRTHFQLAGRNYADHQRHLEQDIARIEQQLISESSEPVRAAQAQNLKILRQRISKLADLNEIVRVIEARLQVVRNSLQLIQDEVFSMSDVHNISQAVDSLIINMEINEELRSSYQAALNDAATLNLDPNLQNQPRLPDRAKQ
jgi:hypothetical protein